MSKTGAIVLRALRPDDLDAVVAIDARLTGRPRRMFFEKRLDAALAAPAGFVTAAIEEDGGLSGYAIARVNNGEFDDKVTLAVLDVIGIEPGHEHHHLGTRLVEGLVAGLRTRGIGELRTQVDWQNQNLMHFFTATGFRLAPSQVLERQIPSGR